MGEEPDKQEQPQPAKRGEAAWKANLERIAERNAKVKKEGKEQRAAYERGKDEQRRRRELRQWTKLPGTRGSD